MSERRKVIAIDFDGCISMGAWPELGPPNMHVINNAIKEKESGAALILWTCRTDRWLAQAVKYCSELGLEFDAVNDNLPEVVEGYGENCRKIVADEYWDDLAVRIGSGYNPQEVIPLKDVERLIDGITSLIEKYRSSGARDVGFSATHFRMMLRRLESRAYEAVKVADAVPGGYYEIAKEEEMEEKNGEEDT